MIMQDSFKHLNHALFVFMSVSRWLWHEHVMGSEVDAVAELRLAGVSSVSKNSAWSRSSKVAHGIFSAEQELKFPSPLAMSMTIVPTFKLWKG
jgi:hypothetical protein